MVSKRTGRSGHTGSTDGGNVRDVKIDRIGPVTIYKRGRSYYLYYRENRKTHRKRVDGNLAVAKATALKVAASIGENQPSPISFNATDPKAMVEQYLDFVEKVQDLAWRTQDR